METAFGLVFGVVIQCRCPGCLNIFSAFHGYAIGYALTVFSWICEA
ncbi:hypothetical protein GFS31_38290 [Leptolyngbya sp. BL0902]|nr:hypothetical protein GFS31_38290 [Leptolyngbya sp. BL0902]